jgi:hypothetical protein
LPCVDEMSGLFSAAMGVLGAAKDMVSHSRSRIEVLYNLQVWAKACLEDVNCSFFSLIRELLLNQESEFAKKTVKSFARSVIISQMLLQKSAGDGLLKNKFVSFFAEYSQSYHEQLMMDLSMLLTQEERAEAMDVVRNTPPYEKTMLEIGSNHAKTAFYELATLIHQLRLTTLANMEELLHSCERNSATESGPKRLVAFNAYVKQLQKDAALMKKGIESLMSIINGLNDDDPYKKGVRKTESILRKSGLLRALSSFEKPMALPDEKLFSIVRQTSSTNDGMRDLEIFRVRDDLGHSSSDGESDTPDLSDDDDDYASPPVTPPGKRSRKDATIGDEEVASVEPPRKIQKGDDQSQQ